MPASRVPGVLVVPVVLSLIVEGLAVLAAEPLADGTVLKSVLVPKDKGENLLKPDRWVAWQKGFERDGDAFVCDNAADKAVQRGASQTVELNQKSPQPIVAAAWSKAEGVGGSPDTDYSVYLDLIYADGSPLWGQTANFAVGTHDWERREVLVLPEKPVKTLTMHLLLRRHAGKAWFRAPELREVKTPDGACLFDGVPVVIKGNTETGFQVRDVAANSGFVRIEGEALGLKLDCKTLDDEDRRVTFFDVTVSDTTGKDRAITLVYAVDLICFAGWHWLHDPRTSIHADTEREFMNANRFHAGANGRFSRYPLAAVAYPVTGKALGIDLALPAFFRLGASSCTGELFVAYDIGLAPEKPKARIRFCTFEFDHTWGFRGALQRYYEIFPDAFRCRTPEQGLWMPFAKISQVKDWQDFGFKFKEGNDETKWDDEHGIITFRYTEPMTWWMKMPKEMPRTMEAALAEAKRLAGVDRPSGAEKDIRHGVADSKGDRSAQALLTSGYHNQSGQIPARLLDTPWCNGAVWSMNSMPGIQGDVTDFKNKWNPKL
ncbi:MAG: hypothetical protein FJ290_30180, partial [Planctomycetes bacterium]|nr:hypothetical protein [Planctomycetota bacterium]